MALKEEGDARKKKLIGIRCCTHSHKSMESSIKTLAPICETTDLCKLVRFIRYFLKIFVLLMQRMKRCGGDALPLGGDIRRPPLAGGPVMPRISTFTYETSRMKRCGGDALLLGGDIRRPPLARGPVMPRISTIHI
ncbi:hypothetical protein HZH68_013695 [Vespula germanica]|uniref:Uncharacterized protein n=1 Tax=Vespula germanica TaxID=30212 RepID=A0A834MUT1_VESGE|nr:hypothetical protein HZH68_013695 [Vespula germanica]